MKSSVKTAVSLLIAILLFGGITVLSSLGMFSTVEKRFYEPARLKAINGKLDSVADCSNAYITNLLSLLGYEESGFLSSESVVSYVNQAPSDEAVRLFDSLREKLPGLDGMRIVDSAGRRVHYSSYRNDFTILANKRNYSNYQNLKTVRGKDELDYSIVSAFDDEGSGDVRKPKIVCDGEEQRIVISYKLYSDANQTLGFSVLFYINPFDFVNLLVEKHIISINEQMTLISSSDGKLGGFVFGLPKVGQNIFAVEILKKWDEKAFGPDIIVSTDTANLSGITVNQETGESEASAENAKPVNWSLISTSASQFVQVGGLYTSESLEMPGYVRVLLLICAFITVCLIIVILFNARKDDDVIIKSKIKGVQIGLLNEYFEKDVDRKKVAAMIEAQKDALTAKIKKSLGRRGKKYGDDLDVILNRSWEDIINILSGNANGLPAGGISADDMNEIRRMFEEILSSSTLKVQSVPASGTAPVAAVSKSVAAPVADAVEELDDVEALDEVESLDEAEPLDEVEALDEAEPVEEVESLEEAEPVEEVESLEEAEPVEEVESLEEAEPVEEVESLEEAEPVEEVESLEEAEPVEEVESLEEAEPVEEVESLEEAEAVEEVESLEEAESVEEAESLEEAEPVEEAESLDEVDVVEEIDDSEALEPAEEPVSDAEVAELEAEKDSEDGLEPIELEGEDPLVRTIDDSILDEKNVLLEELDDLEEVVPIDPESTDYEVGGVNDLIELEGYNESVSYEHMQATVKYVPTEEYDRNRFEGSEPLEIADHTVIGTEDDTGDFNFEIFKPLDYIFDNVEPEETENEINNDSEDEDPTAEALLLELPTEKDGFMFTAFAANDNNVTELPVDAIVMGDDGVFHISKDLAPSQMPIDEDFKKLVDSVIR